jgi:cyclopropane-fatty-acyl-phospholipid synthase
MLNSVARSTDLTLSHLEDIGPHYARTLRHWRERFLARRIEVRSLGYPESFLRKGGFEERQLGDVQMLLSKPRSRRAGVATVNAPPA